MRSLICLTTLLLAAAPAMAHPGHELGGSGFTAGVVHPLLGIDHLLAILAVAVIGVQIGGRARWALPFAFLTVMAIGGVFGLAGQPSAMLEYAIATSLIVLGGLIAFQTTTYAAVPVFCAIAFGSIHGHAHGTELLANDSAAAYIPGFLLSTAVLLLIGTLAANRLMQVNLGRRGLRWSGAAVAATGVVFALMVGQ
ncbi:HupE/UreJ family protein [soil metagenome]